MNLPEIERAVEKLTGEKIVYGERLESALAKIFAALDRAVIQQEKIATLYDAIAHGDDEHRRWLRQRLEEHFASG